MAAMYLKDLKNTQQYHSAFRIYFSYSITHNIFDVEIMDASEIHEQTHMYVWYGTRRLRSKQIRF